MSATPSGSEKANRIRSNRSLAVAIRTLSEARLRVTTSSSPSTSQPVGWPEGTMVAQPGNELASLQPSRSQVRTVGLPAMWTTKIGSGSAGRV